MKLLPSPLPGTPPHLTVWDGGVRVAGPQLLIPGRTLDEGQLDEAEQHALSVLAAVELMRGGNPATPVVVNVESVK